GRRRQSGVELHDDGAPVGLDRHLVDGVLVDLHRRRLGHGVILPRRVGPAAPRRGGPPGRRTPVLAPPRHEGPSLPGWWPPPSPWPLGRDGPSRRSERPHRSRAAGGPRWPARSATAP